MWNRLLNRSIGSLIAAVVWAVLGLEVTNMAWVISHGASYGRWLFHGAVTAAVTYCAAVLLGGEIKNWPGGK